MKHDIAPFVIDNEKKLFYYRGLREFTTQLGYLIEAYLAAQDAYQEWVGYFYPKVNVGEE